MFPSTFTHYHHMLSDKKLNYRYILAGNQILNEEILLKFDKCKPSLVSSILTFFKATISLVLVSLARSKKIVIQCNIKLKTHQ